VLTLVAEGKTNKEIAAVMRLSPKTVSTVFQKLQLGRSGAAVARMIRGERAFRPYALGPFGETGSTRSSMRRGEYS
jgi:hypothetical protein